MEFTNDIKFSEIPTANQILKISYKGKLFKENSSEAYIIYGYGENWEKTTEKKMEKNTNEFSVNVQIENYSTFNFCFRNEKNIWDNNNTFNYISAITPDFKENKIENSENVINILTEELEKNESNSIETQINSYENFDSSLSNSNSEINENDFDLFFDKLYENSENTSVESYNDINNIFNEIIEKFEQKQDTEPKDIETVDIGKELDKVFDETFNNNSKINNNTDSETYIPESDSNNVFKANSQELTEIFSEIVENISKVEETTNSKVDSLNYDYSDFFDFFDFENKNEIENDIFDFSNLDFDLTNNENSVKLEENNIFDFSNLNFDLNTNKNIEKSEENNIFDFSNLNFDFNEKTQQIENDLDEQTNIVDNESTFSDSFYDDEDISIHNAYTNFQEMLNNVVNDFEEKVSKANLLEVENNTNTVKNEEIQAQNNEFNNQVNEYVQYFDNIIDEIISTPNTSLSTPVSTEQVIAVENQGLTLKEAQALESVNQPNSDISTDSVSNEYALFDYKSHSFVYMLKRRFKLIFNTVFSKMPKVFGKEENSDNN